MSYLHPMHFRCRSRRSAFSLEISTQGVFFGVRPCFLSAADIPAGFHRHDYVFYQHSLTAFMHSRIGEARFSQRRNYFFQRLAAPAS